MNMSLNIQKQYLYHNIYFENNFPGTIVFTDIESNPLINRRMIVSNTKVKIGLNDSNFNIFKDIHIINNKTGEQIPVKIYINFNDNIFIMDVLILEFTMPDSDVTIKYTKNKNKKRRILKMEPKTNQQTIIDTFEIPEIIAKRLSELLTIQTIREKILDQNIDNPTKYEQIEKMLIPVVSEIEALKTKITKDYVPKEYRSDEYMWNYDGYEIDGCSVQILH